MAADRNQRVREQHVQRLEQRNAYLEGELKLLAQHHTNSLKDLITLRQTPAKRRRAAG